MRWIAIMLKSAGNPRMGNSRNPIIRLALACLGFCVSGFSLPAFPGAEGWGAETPGGRGPGGLKPKVFVVTTLASSGPGSFVEAFRASGPRFILFRVSGVIDLQPEGNGQWYIRKQDAYVTIAGQTSPGGITFAASQGGSTPLFGYHSEFHDGVFRFLRFRARQHNNDAFAMNGADNFIIDHCDFSGAGDETLDITASSDFTVQWSTITNSSAGQTYGFLMAYLPTSHVSFHHNLMAHHVNRFPHIHWGGGTPPDNGRIDYRNNVLYDGGDYFLNTANAGTPAASVRMNIVGNTFKAGPQSPPNSRNEAGWFFSMVSLGREITGYENDNVMIPREGPVNTVRVGERTPNKVAEAWPMPAVTTQSAPDAYGLVLDKAGAWPRDAMNVRTVAEVRAGTGRFRRDDDPLIIEGPPPPADSDLDGMPDAWETGMGLDPRDPSDNVEDKDGDGYLNIEEYINDVALARLGEQPLNPQGAAAIPVFDRASNHRGGLRLLREQAGRVLRILLPGNARVSGGIDILDMQGRVRASFPASEDMLWKPAPEDPAGLYTVLWRDNGGLAGMAKAVLAP